MTQRTHEIGIGQLGWHGSERRSDRYGTVRLFFNGSPCHDCGDKDPNGPPHLVAGVLGRKGRLVAEVRETRDSEHVGDLFRGLFPTRPQIGERIVLGEGTLFVESQGANACVGLKPDDGRDDDWLDPRALYRAHQQTVRLVFEFDDEVQP